MYTLNRVMGDKTMKTNTLEATTRYQILIQLQNLGWIVDESKENCNVTQERPATKEQKEKLRGYFPDFVLYQYQSTIPIGIIEAKKPGKSLRNILDEAETKYAKPLNAPLIIAYNDTYIETRDLRTGRPLKIDGDDVRSFFDHATAMRFINEGTEILSAPPVMQQSREQLIKIFKNASNKLREAGLTQGLERFSAFSDILFLKLMDEKAELMNHANLNTHIPDYLRWSNFKDKKVDELYMYLRDVVWTNMNKMYGDVFGDRLPIEEPTVLKQIIDLLSEINLTTSDTDVKGDAFEYFLKNAYQGMKIKDLGEYFTPRNIVRFMVSMIDPQMTEKIYDPFCGTGGFLIESFRYLQLRTNNPNLLNKLKNETIFGSEITSTARIAKMNMILYGDGHNNVYRKDSLANPYTNKFDVVLTNIPYSQQSEHGNKYNLDTKNGNAICVAHCFQSLNEHGRAAILIPESFLTDGGAVEIIRTKIFKNSKNINIISLPRNMFHPYTPTKTNILYFEKNGEKRDVTFYMIKNVGYELSARRKPIQDNDLPLTLEAFNKQELSTRVSSYSVNRDTISKNNYSLWVYDYYELIPKTDLPLVYLGDYIEEISDLSDLSKCEDEMFHILGVNNHDGVYLNEILPGGEIKQKYKKVSTNDIVYNPHRINVGSIGIVTEDYDGGLLSPKCWCKFQLIVSQVI
jgi:type I restriction enzyme M protein